MSRQYGPEHTYPPVPTGMFQTQTYACEGLTATPEGGTTVSSPMNFWIWSMPAGTSGQNVGSIRPQLHAAPND